MMSLPVFPDQNRPDRAVISIMGETALAWLHNLLTCDVSTLGAGSAAYGALLNPQGKILHDMFVFFDGTRVLIDCAAEQRALLLQKLTMYRLRAKLMIEMDNEFEVGVHVEKPEGVTCYPDPRLPAMGWRSFVGTGTLINVPAHHGYDERRITLGIADSAQDIGVEKTFPHEVNFDQFGGLSFTKGCYVGQEVVSRMQHRGTARNRMLPVAYQSKPTETKITSGDKIVGELHSRGDRQGLALLRIDRLAESTGPLMAGKTLITVHKPDWVNYEVGR